MTTPRKGFCKHTAALILLGLLMVSHLLFLGNNSRHCHDLNRSHPEQVTEECKNPTDTFQRAAETYIAIILALMAPLPTK